MRNDPTNSPAHHDRRQQLIDATRRCISEHGLSNTTLARVAKAAGLSAGIVNFYFHGKQQLLLETLRALSREYREAMSLAFEFGESPLEVLSDVIRVHFSAAICTPEKIAVWYTFSGESSARRDYLKICREHDAQFQESLHSVVAHLCRRSNGKQNATAIARGLEGLLDGYWQDFLYDPKNFDADAAIATCESYVSAFFNAEQHTATVPTFDSTIGDLLAPWTYQSEELLQLEKKYLFKQHWQLAGHTSDIPAAGDYLTFDALGERALVVRGDDGEVRAFHNVCRHRGARLADGSGRCSALVCPFHGWTYRLDGALVGVPAEATFADLDKGQHGLVPLAVEVWMGFVFVCFTGEAPPLAATMQPVEDLLSVYQTHNMQPLADSRFDETHPVNWKVIHDIDNEGYHVPHGHPALQQLYGNDYRDEVAGADAGHGVPVARAYLNEQPGKLWSVRHYQKLLPTFDHLPDEHQRLWLYVALFPNMVLALYPDCMEFYMTVPVDAQKTRLLGAAYSLPDARREVRAAQYLNARINRATYREDNDFVRRLQDGMQSAAFPQPRLSSIEQGVREFHHELQRALPVTTLTNPPAAGTLAQINANMHNDRDL